MFSQIRPAVVLMALLTLITGVGYPLVVTGIASIAFADKAHGSVIIRDGKAIGSDLIAQPFTDAKYFWPRPSAANYNGAGGSGSNLGPTNPALAAAVKARVEALKAADPDNTAPVPIDLVTASGSGLDPHISEAAARYQVARVARARGMSNDKVQALVDQHIESPTFGALGEARVNVLRLNLALDVQ
jgi:K+-transporting ATPase ATPase C chain